MTLLEWQPLGFRALELTQRVCQAQAEIRDVLRPSQTMTEFVSLLVRRMHLIERVEALQQGFPAVTEQWMKEKHCRLKQG